MCLFFEALLNALNLSPILKYKNLLTALYLFDTTKISQNDILSYMNLIFGVETNKEAHNATSRFIVYVDKYLSVFISFAMVGRSVLFPTKENEFVTATNYQLNDGYEASHEYEARHGIIFIENIIEV